MLKRSLLCTASARAIRALEVYERTIVRLAIVAFGTTVLLSWPAYPAPQGGDVVGGSATIGRSGAATTVDQASEKAIINWQAFSIASGETVNFNQPGPSSIALNRVVGGNLSEIYGALRSNGRLILVNP
jgi:large exoprotein involved in heme utilization and adhesion